jgi:hypothetical protein
VPGLIDMACDSYFSKVENRQVTEVVGHHTGEEPPVFSLGQPHFGI